MRLSTYFITEIQEKREKAGLGVLSLGLYGTGDLVSNTPIPGSRMGNPANGPDLGYGGYLLGEGMTREAATYLGSLHNLFPSIQEVLRQADEVRIDLIKILGETPAMWDWDLSDLVREAGDRLKRTPTIEEWNDANTEIQRLQEEVKINVHDCCKAEKVKEAFRGLLDRIAELEQHQREDVDLMETTSDTMSAGTAAIKSARARIEELEAERDRFRTALDFYANPANYDQFGIIHSDPKDCFCGMKHHHPDMGFTAREALKN